MGFWIFMCLLVICLTIVVSVFLINAEGFYGTKALQFRLREIDKILDELEKRLKGVTPCE